MTEERIAEESKEGVAEDLQKKLREFATAEPDVQKLQLKELIGLIEQTVTSDVLARLVDSEFQKGLQTAISSTLETPIDIDGEAIEDVWNGSYTIVAVDESGTVKGTVFSPPDDLTPYGGPEHNFYASPLVKTLASMYLHKAGLKGGIGDNKSTCRKLQRENLHIIWDQLTLQYP